MSVIQLAPDVIEAFNDANEAFDTLNECKSAVNHIEAGDHPDLDGHGDWKSIAKNYMDAAAAIQAAPVLDDFDATPYTISEDDLGVCANMAANMAKLNAYKSALIDYANSGNVQLDRINTQIANIAVARDGLTYLVGVFADAVDDPKLEPYQDIFAIDWNELQGDVNHAFETFASAVNDQKKQLNAVIAGVNTQIGNLSANMVTLTGLCG